MANKSVTNTNNSLQSATSAIKSLRKNLYSGMLGASTRFPKVPNKHEVFRDVDLKKYNLNGRSIYVRKGQHLLGMNLRSGDIIIPRDKKISEIFRSDSGVFLVMEMDYSVAKGKRVSAQFDIRTLEVTPIPQIIYALQEGGPSPEEMMESVTNLKDNHDEYGDMDSDRSINYILDWIKMYEDRINPVYKDVIPGLLLLKEMN